MGEEKHRTTLEEKILDLCLNNPRRAQVGPRGLLFMLGLHADVPLEEMTDEMRVESITFYDTPYSDEVEFLPDELF